MGPANATRLTTDGLDFRRSAGSSPGTTAGCSSLLTRHLDTQRFEWYGDMDHLNSAPTNRYPTTLAQIVSVDATVQPCSVQVTLKPDMRFQVVAWFRVNAHTSMMHFQHPSWKMAWIVIALGILLINLLSKLVQSWQVEFASCFTQNASMRLPALEGFLWVKGMWCLHKKRQRY